jgi:hypothetical protein
MARVMLKQYLSQAEDFIDPGRQRVERLTLLVQQLKADGRDPTAASTLLDQFNRSMETFIGDRDLIERLLRESERKR